MADFSIIFFYDKFIKLELKQPSLIRKERGENKNGTYALLKNSEVRQANIEKYMNAICKRLGLDYENELNPKNLEKLVIRLLNGRSALYYIGWTNVTSKIQQITNDISELISDYKDYSKPLSDDAKEQLASRYSTILRRVKEIYQDEDLLRNRKRVLNITNTLKSENKIEELNIFNRFLSIGEYITNSLISNTINTIEDMRLIIIKINSINQLLTNNDLRMTSNMRSAIDNLKYDDNDTYYFLTKIKSEEGFEKANQKVDIVEKYVKSIL